MKWGNNTATHILLAHSCFRPHARLFSFCDQCDSHVPVAHCASFARNFWWVPNGKRRQGTSRAKNACNQSKISAQAGSRAVVHSHGDDGNPRRCGQSSSRWACCERTGDGNRNKRVRIKERRRSSGEWQTKCGQSPRPKLEESSKHSRKLRHEAA